MTIWQETVTVYENEKQYEVTVAHKSKTVWEASGMFDDIPDVRSRKPAEIRVKAQSKSAALELWKSTARYRGNL
ncbi:MAG: hypothetical protein ACREHF_14610 [Rhizomicrobium sp.]